MGVSVRLVPMTESEFDEYEAAEAIEYAAENVRAGYWAEEEAIERARQAHRQLLPKGAHTPGHHFCHIIEAAGGARVGAIWWYEDRVGDPARAFVYHVIVDPPMRRKGLATAALKAVEAEARAMGLAAIGLHVFAHNPGAILAYEKLGFRTSSLNMLKPLTTKG